MSIVVKCDRCGKEIVDDDERVIFTATKYTLYDPNNLPAVAAPPGTTGVPGVDPSMPPGTIVAPPTPTPPLGQPFPLSLAGSTRQFVAQQAFDGQLEMHLACWEEWINL